MEAGTRQGGVGGWFKRMTGAAGAGLAFASLYLIPVKQNRVPESPRLQPAY
jgi:magnesium-protoporphyrin IX monomethyl ester (oxidative) cyclase